MQRIIVTLTQEPTGDYRVKSLSGTAELLIGQVVESERVKRWTLKPQITVRVVGLTPGAEPEEQIELMDAPKRKAVKDSQTLTVAR